jgi:hypothetical protein
MPLTSSTSNRSRPASPAWPPCSPGSSRDGSGRSAAGGQRHRAVRAVRQGRPRVLRRPEPVLRRIARAPLYDINEETGGPAFWRDFSGTRRTTCTPARAGSRPGHPRRGTTGRRVPLRAGTAGGRPATSVTATWARASTTFHWSAADRRWYWEMDGRAQRTSDGKRLAASSVLIQNVRITPSRFRDFTGARSPDIDTVGSGTALLLRDGKAYPVAWSRPSAASRPDDGRRQGRDPGGRPDLGRAAGPADPREAALTRAAGPLCWARSQ